MEETLQAGRAHSLSFTRPKAAPSRAEVVSSAHQTSSRGSLGILQPDQGRRLSRASALLHRTMDSPPSSPRLGSIGSVMSPFSSADSLASLVERQQQSKIIHPHHQLFGNSEKKPSPLRAGDTTPDHTRQLHPSLANPHHMHSSNAVKESSKVSLAYDPVSRKKVLNSYEIIKELGRGEHGKVKLARHLENGELVAIKIVDRQGRSRAFRPSEPSHEEKIRREIAIMKKTNHPNVVKLIEVLDDESSRKIYLVLEYVEKGEVKWQKALGVPAMSIAESLQAFRGVVLGLEYLHYQGIIHRDIKPANLLISRDGSVKISDFGVSFASSLRSGEQDDYDLAKTAGTPAFLAPELCRPMDLSENQHPKITYKIDIWALGVTLYCFLFGRLPFWANNEFELFNVIVNSPLQLPETFPQDFKPEDKGNVRNFIVKILDKDPARRLTIRQIKQHPFTLRGLSMEDAAAFLECQKSCESKIKVSSEEVQVAVTGPVSKLRKGIAKALKFAGLGPKEESPRVPRMHTNSFFLNDESLSKGASSSGLSEASTLRDKGTARHRRVKSGDAASLNTATVEGDLFLRTGSAFLTLNSIMDTDKHRSSGSSLAGAGISSTGSTESSLPSGSRLVSLPVNASFASLDSVYMDNYAPAYEYTSVTNAQNPEQGHVIKKMNSFTMNQDAAEPNLDEAVPPHAKFDFDADSDEETDSSTDGDYGNDNMSQLSIPSHLIHDMSVTSRQKSINSSHRSSRRQTQRGMSKYSFMDHSSSDSEPEVIFAHSTDEEEQLTAGPIPVTPPRIIHASPEPPEDSSSSPSSSSDGDSLILAFGPRRRNNTITLASPPSPPSGSSHGRKRTFLQRVASPLAHNAPKTPGAREGAHLTSEYVNHYHRVLPHLGGSVRDDTGRSNSITLGILDHKHDASFHE